MRHMHGIEMHRQAGAIHLQIQTLAMGIGDQNDTLASRFQCGKKLDDIRMHRNQVRQFLLQLHDVEFELLRPEIDAVPVQCSGFRVKPPKALGMRLGVRHAVPFGEFLRHMDLPEMVVEMQVEQGSIHIEQNRINQAPIEFGAHISPSFDMPLRRRMRRKICNASS